MQLHLFLRQLMSAADARGPLAHHARQQAGIFRQLMFRGG